jgi:hypothetical protein
LIFLKARSSTRHVQALTTSMPSAANSNHQNARDIHLLKHILLIFTVFVGGWTPVYIHSVTTPDETSHYIIYSVLQLLPILSSLIIILDLFWYNHDLRQYLKERLLSFLHLNQHWIKKMFKKTVNSLICMFNVPRKMCRSNILFSALIAKPFVTLT